MNFIGAHGHLPMGAALRPSAIFGVLLVAVPTVVRIGQVRLMAVRNGGPITAAAQTPSGSRKPAGV